MCDNNRYIFQQGDQGRIYFQVVISDQLFQDYLIDDIEICVERFVRKLKSEGEIWYHPEIQAFSFVLSQEDTMFLRPGFYITTIRVKLKDFDGTGYNFIHTIDSPEFQIIPGFSKEIL